MRGPRTHWTREFRAALPEVGFSWPVPRARYAEYGTPMRSTLSLPAMDCRCILQAVCHEFAGYAVDTYRAYGGYGAGWRRGLATKQVMDEAMGWLMLAVQDAAASSTVNLSSYRGRGEFWRTVKTSDVGGTWFADDAVRPEALQAFVVLAIEARQYYLERLGARPRNLHEEGMLARAVDELVNLLEFEFADQPGVLDYFFQDAAGVVHPDGGGYESEESNVDVK